VYYKRSTGAGAPSTWEPARRISHDDGATIHARPVIAARGEDLHVVWFGITPQVGASVFYVTSGDGGTTFGRPVALTPRAIRVEAHPSVAASPRGSAHVIWYQPDGHGADQIAHRARRAPRSGREAGSAPAWD